MGQDEDDLDFDSVDENSLSAQDLPELVTPPTVDQALENFNQGTSAKVTSPEGKSLLSNMQAPLLSMVDAVKSDETLESFLNDVSEGGKDAFTKAFQPGKGLPKNEGEVIAVMLAQLIAALSGGAALGANIISKIAPNGADKNSNVLFNALNNPTPANAANVEPFNPADFPAPPPPTFTPAQDAAQAKSDADETEQLFAINAPQPQQPSPTVSTPTPGATSSAPENPPIVDLAWKLSKQGNRQKWNVGSYSLNNKKPASIKLSINGGGKAVVSENAQGGLNYGIKGSHKKDAAIATLCQMAVETAKPGTEFDLSKTPEKEKARVFEELSKAIETAKAAGKTVLPTIKGYTPPAAEPVTPSVKKPK